MEFENIIFSFKIAHCYAIFICLYREMRDVDVKRIGSLMKALEVVGVYMFFAVIVMCLHHYSFWMFDFEIKMLEKF